MTLDLTTDCADCVGLCCKTFAFEPGPDFAIEKPAGQSCPHLGTDHLCAIHETRVERGFSGCLVFDCQGAGPRIVHETFRGADWRNDMPVRGDMIDAFRILREVHRLYGLLDLSGALPLDDTRQSERASLMEVLDVQPVSAGWLARFETGPIPARVAKYLKSLQSLVPRS